MDTPFRTAGNLAVSSAGLFVVVGIWAFAALAGEVLEGDTTKYDERILIALRQPGNLAEPIGPHWTLQVARDLTAMGGVTVLGIVFGVVGGYLSAPTPLRVAHFHDGFGGRAEACWPCFSKKRFTAPGLTWCPI